ncbi:MAG: cytochrome c [Candidatus Sericytochromatia bacterium]|nr:cytochrome c [Candidatus Sericytochromatia bacterium]
MLKGGIREWREKGYATEKVRPAAGSARGAQLYRQHCATCHGRAGEGVAGHFPPLSGDPLLAAPEPWGAIYVTLYGLKGRRVAGRDWQAAMGGFARFLSDEEAAALLSHARQAFGGNARAVTAADVRRVRAEVEAARAQNRQ